MTPSQTRVARRAAYQEARRKREALVPVQRVVDRTLQIDLTVYDGEVFHGGKTPRASARRALYAVLEASVILERAGMGVLRVRFYGTILIDPPWRFNDRGNRVSPEHQKVWRYRTMAIDEILDLPVDLLAAKKAHLYLWVPNTLIDEGIRVVRAWGFSYKTKVEWVKVNRNGTVDRSGMGWYFRSATEPLLFATKGKLRTGKAARSLPNVILAPRRGHSRKPDEAWALIEQVSPGPYLELFARYPRKGWTQWGDEAPTVGGENA